MKLKNFSQIKSFFKNNKKLVLIMLLIVLVSISLFFYHRFSPKGDGLFKLNTILLKSVVKKGDQISSSFKITNLKETKDFDLKAKNLEKLVYLSESRFRLGEGEEKSIAVVFRADFFETEPGVYVGKLIVETDLEKKEIPIIIEIQSEAVFFATNLEIGATYKEIKPGDKTSVGVKIFNLKDTETHTLEMTSEIRNLDGEIIVSETENIVVGTETLITKTISLPETLALGNYVFSVVTRFEDKYGEYISTSSYLFGVVKKRELKEFDVNSLTIIFSIIVVVFLFGIVALIIYMMHERDKLFLELRKQQMREMQFYMQKIEEKKRARIAKVKRPKEKRKIIREFKKIKKKARKKIKEKHSEQKIVFRKLRKQKKKSEMKSKLGQWKREGFNVDELMAITKPGKHEKKDLEKWEKKGFDVSVLRT